METESQTQPSDTSSTLAATRVAKPLAPEDIRRGDYVAILYELHELPSYWWPADTSLLPRDEPVRVTLLPADECRPLKIESVCLPFVLAKQPTGDRRTLDVRRARLARLDQHFAVAAWKAYKKKQPESE